MPIHKAIVFFDTACLNRMKIISIGEDGTFVFTAADGASTSQQAKMENAPSSSQSEEESTVLLEVRKINKALHAYFRHVNFQYQPPLSEIVYNNVGVYVFFVLFYFFFFSAFWSIVYLFESEGKPF